MSQDKIISFKNPSDEFPDLLTEIARRGAREMLAKAIELEVQDFLEDFQSQCTALLHESFFEKSSPFPQN